MIHDCVAIRSRLILTKICHECSARNPIETRNCTECGREFASVRLDAGPAYHNEGTKSPSDPTETPGVHTIDCPKCSRSNVSRVQLVYQNAVNIVNKEEDWESRRLTVIGRGFGPSRFGDLDAAAVIKYLHYPRKPSKPTIGTITTVCVLVGAFVILLMVGSAELDPHSNIRHVAWLLNGVLIGGFGILLDRGTFAKRLDLHQTKERRWAKSTAVWMRMFYCPDCQSVFDPFLTGHAPVRRAQAFIRLASSDRQ